MLYRSLHFLKSHYKFHEPNMHTELSPLILPLNPRDPAHAQALVDLLDLYARDPMGGGHPLGDEARQHLADRLSKRADYFGFLALIESRPVGLMNCFEGFSSFAARPLLNIHDLAVLSEWRGRGIGRALMSAAEKLAQRRGCCKLTLEVLSNNAPALRAYAGAGFEAYQLDPAAGQAMFMHKWL